MAAVSKLDIPGAIADSAYALHHLGDLPEVAGRQVGVLGFCLGGTLAYHVAAVAQPATAVCLLRLGHRRALECG